MSKESSPASWKKSRARVQDIRIERLLREAWRAAFPMVEDIRNEPDGTDNQRLGIDRWLVLADGREIPVEDKVRFRRYSGDILLELNHEFADRTEPGWIRKPLRCQYLGYLWVDSGRFEVYPFLLLQSWWCSLNPGRSANLPLYKARNPTYTTVNMAVRSSQAWLGLRQQATQNWEVIDAKALEADQGGLVWDSPIRTRFDEEST